MLAVGHHPRPQAPARRGPLARPLDRDHARHSEGILDGKKDEAAAKIPPS
jgi:hypothetical protein